MLLVELFNEYPAGIFDVVSTLNRRRNFDGRRKSVEISTVVEISTLIRRRYFDGRRKSVEKRKNISTVVEKALKFRQS